MSRSGECTVEFGGEERSFRLGIKQWEKIQEKCDAGPPELLARLAPPFFAKQQGLTANQIMAAGLLGTWRIHDVREVIFQGLLGANMAAPEALKLVRDWVDDRPLMESAAVAYEIVFAGYAGVEDEKAMGEPQAAAGEDLTSLAAKSGSEKMVSTPTAGLSDGPQSRSAQ